MKQETEKLTQANELEVLRARVAVLEQECERLKSAAAEVPRAPAGLGPEIQRLADALPLRLSYVDAQERLVFVNRAYEDNLGRDRKALYERPIREILGQGFYNRVKTHITFALSGRATSFEVTVQSETGEEGRTRTSYLPDVGTDGQVRGFFSIVQDVPRPKRLETSSDKTQDLYERTERLARLGHYEWDELVDRCTYCSKEMAELHGFTVEEYLALCSDTEGDVLLVHPEDRERYQSAVKDLTKDGLAFDLEYRLLQSGGGFIEVREVLEPIFDSDGRLVRSIGYVQDITERRQSDRALRESERRFKDFADASSHWLWEMDSEFRFTFLSEGITRVTGEHPADFIGKTRWDIAGDNPANPELLHANQAHMERHEIFEDLIYERPNLGGYGRLYLSVSGRPVFDADGRFQGYRGSAKDVTEQVRVLEELRQSEALFAQAALIGTLGHWVWDVASDTCTYCSDGLAQIFGITPEAFMERYASQEKILQHIHPDDRERYDKVIEEAWAEPKGFDIEFREYMPNGELHYMRERGEPVFDDSGQHVRTIGIVQDITRDKLVEAELLKTQDLFEHTERLARLGHFEWDELADRCSYCSKELARLHGLTVAQYLEQCKGEEDDLKVVHPDDQKLYRQVLRAEHHEGKGFDIEYRLRRANGEYIEVREELEPIFDESGRLVRSVGYVQDISERKAAERALMESEKRFRDFVDASSHWLWEMGPDLRFTYISDSITKVTGELPSDFIGKTRREIAGEIPADSKALRENLALMDRHESFEDFLFDRPKMNGGRVYLYLSGKPIFDDKGVFLGYRGTARDVTERTRMIEEIHQSEALLRQAAEIANLGHWAWDEIENRCVFCSDGLARMNGQTVEEYLASHATMEDICASLHPDDQERYAQVIEQAARARSSYELVFRKSLNGVDYRYFRERGEPIFDERGQHVRTVGILQDITKDREAEEAVRKSEALLHQAAEMANLGHWAWDETIDRCVYCSESLARMNNVTVEGYLARFGTMEALLADVHPDDRRRYQKVIADAYDRKVPYEIEFRDRGLDGRYRYFRERGEPVFDEHGEHVRTIGILQDITKDKEAEEALRKSEAALARAQQVAKLGHWSWSIERDELTSFSEEYARIHGVPADQIKEHLVYQMERVIHPDDRERVESEFRRFDTEGLDYEIEYRLIRPDGEIRHVEEIGEAVWDSSGRAIAHSGTLQDITDRKLAEEALQRAHDELESRVRQRTAELSQANVALRDKIAEHERTVEALRQSEEQIRLITDSLPAIIVMLDSERRYKFVNKTFEDWHHSSAQKIIGRTVRSVVGELQYSRVVDHLDRAMAGELVAFELPATFVDGRTRHLNAVYVPQTDSHGNVQNIIGIATDISDRKRAEEALLENRELLEAIIDAAPIGINVKDPWSRYVFMNRYQAEVYGVTPQMAVGKTPGQLIGKAYGDYISGLDGRVVDSKRALPYFEERVPDKDARMRTWLTTKVPVLGKKDNLRYVVSASLDVTDLKAREEQLKQAQKMDAVGRMTGGIAHDFNNLLFVIQGSLVLLEHEVEASEDVSQAIDSIKAAAGLGADLTRSLLAFSRQQPLDPVPVDLAISIRGTVKTILRTLAPEIEVRTSFVGDVWPILIDRQQLENAILNLALNARDAMTGPGTLTISAENARQEEAHKDGDLRRGDFVKLTVSDDGMGMGSEVIDQAFDPFFTTKPVGSGTGLGLSMVYGFVKQSGGRIDVKSRPGAGTTIIMYLPRATVSEAASEPSPCGLDAITGGSETVLVTEDSEQVRQVAVKILNRLGYRTLEAADGKAALEILSREPGIDLLFTDVVLPGGLSGYELAKQAKQLRPELKALFCTGYSRGTQTPEQAQDQAGQLIAKPYDPDALGRSVRRVLDQVSAKEAQELS